ncbi:MAG: hypothetical protein AB2421_18280 [Thermotaleaceae bacterium]
MKYINPYGLDSIHKNERENKQALERIESYMNQIVNELKGMGVKLEKLEATNEK